MSTSTEIIGSIYGSPGDALKLLEGSVRVKGVALKDVNEDVVSVAAHALGRMLADELADASKLAYTSGDYPSVTLYDKDGSVGLTFDVICADDETITVEVDTNTIIDAIECYETQRNQDIALHPISLAAEIYGRVKVRIPLSDELRTLCRAAAWHYSVPVLLNDIPGKLAQ